jgi:hypothetical protein
MEPLANQRSDELRVASHVGVVIAAMEPLADQRSDRADSDVAGRVRDAAMEPLASQRSGTIVTLGLVATLVVPQWSRWRTSGERPSRADQARHLWCRNGATEPSAIRIARLAQAGC